jgi:hypothetical protein
MNLTTPKSSRSRQSFRARHQVDDDSDYEPPTPTKRRNPQPAYPKFNTVTNLDRDVHDIFRLDSFPIQYYEQCQDRLGLIMKMLNDMDYDTRARFIAPRLQTESDRDLWRALCRALEDMLHPGSIPWVTGAASHKKFARLFLCWYDCRSRRWSEGFSKSYLEGRMRDEKIFSKFLVDLRLAITPFDGIMSFREPPQKGTGSSSAKQR